MTKFNEGRSYLLFSESSPTVQAYPAVEIPMPPMGTIGIGNTLTGFAWCEVQGSATSFTAEIQGQPQTNDDVLPANWRVIGTLSNVTSGNTQLIQIERAYVYRINVTARSGSGLINVWILY